MLLILKLMVVFDVLPINDSHETPDVVFRSATPLPKHATRTLKDINRH